jgi:hypothetical protein
MTKRLRISDEYRFVRAFALAVDPGDTLGLLIEIGALGSPDIGIVRRTRKALIPAYDRASDRPLPAGNGKDWEQAHTISVLREALAQSDSAAYLAYRLRDNHRAAHTATEASPVSSAESYAEALTIIGCAADSGYLGGSLGLRRRPWEILGNDLSLPEWQERVWKLLFAMPDNALPRPSEQPAAGAAPCLCSQADSPTPLGGPRTPRLIRSTVPVHSRKPGPGFQSPGGGPGAAQPAGQRGASHAVRGLGHSFPEIVVQSLVAAASRQDTAHPDRLGSPA